MEAGISKAGKVAEARFIQLTGAENVVKASDGDVILDGHLIEIKQVKAPTGYTLNQVRAVKYLPLVVLHIPTDTWYVVPPDEIVARVAQRKRGQHTENPFESATLNLRTLQEFIVEEPRRLREATLGAVERGDCRPELREAMMWVHQSSVSLAEESVVRVRKLLGSLL